MILVTGATGKSGREIVTQLSAAGAQVRALVRDPAKAAWLAALPGVEIVQGDLSKPETLPAALAHVGHVLLLSPATPNSGSEQNNLIAAAMRAAAPPHIVKFSALGADANAPEGFLRWHGQIEGQLEASGLYYTNLQPTVFMQEMLNSWAGQKTIYLPMAETPIALVDTRDIAAVAVKALTEAGHAGKSYPITGPAALTMREMAAQISAATGEQVNYVNVTPEQWAQSLRDMKLPEWLISGLGQLYDNLRAGGGAEVSGTVRAVAGKEPITFAEFAREHAAQFKGAGA